MAQKRKTYHLSEKDFTIVKESKTETVFELKMGDYRIRIIDGIVDKKRSNIVMWGTYSNWIERAMVRTFSDACLIAQKYKSQINKINSKNT